MNPKNYQLAFDYDNTLAKEEEKINPSLSKIIFNLIGGKKVSIITSRSMWWMKKNNTNILKMILSAKRGLFLYEKEKIAKNFILYSGRGNEKFLPSFIKDELNLIEDLKYKKCMPFEDISLIHEILKQSLPKNLFLKKEELIYYPSTSSNEVLRSVMRVKRISPRLKKEICSKINLNIQRINNNRIKKIFLDIGNDSIGFSFKNKSFAIKDVLKNNPKKIIYYGDSPKGNDKPIFDLSKGELKDEVDFIIVKNPSHTLNLIKNLNNKN